MVLCAQCRRIWRSYCFIYFIIFFSRRIFFLPLLALVCTHLRYILINSHSSKWNWSNGILKSDTLLPFHLFLFDMCTATWTVHPVGGVYGDRDRDRESQRHTHAVLLIMCSAQHFSSDITFRRYVSTLFVNASYMCGVALVLAPYLAVGMCRMHISKLELVHCSR